MQEFVQQWTKFTKSELCIFEFNSIDFPTPLQQHLIASYFQLNDMLRQFSHTDIVKMLHSHTDKSSQVFIPGLVYHIILDSTTAVSLCESYLPIMRSESWINLDRLLQQILRQSFQNIKEKHRKRLLSLLSKFHYYGNMNAQLLIAFLKTLSCHFVNQNNLQYNSFLIHSFSQILIHLSQELKEIVINLLFYQLPRMICMLPPHQSRGEHRRHYIKIIKMIFEMDSKSCLSMGEMTLRNIQFFSKDQELIQFIENCKPFLLTSYKEENMSFTLIRLGSVLPFQVENALTFIIQNRISKMQTNMQLNWALGKPEENKGLLLIDTLRYVLCLDPQICSHQQAINILQWLLFRSCSNPFLFEQWKNQLFYYSKKRIFFMPYAPEKAIRLISYLFVSNFDYGQNLLQFLIKDFQDPQKSSQIYQLLNDSQSLGSLDLNYLLYGSRLSVRTKQKLQYILGKNKNYQNSEMRSSEQQKEYYDPLSHINRKQSEMSLQFSDNEESPSFKQSFDGHKKGNLKGIDSFKQDDQIMISQQANDYVINIQKIFLQDMGESLLQVLKEPTIDTYRIFYKKFIEISKNCKVNDDDQELIEIFVAQTAKLTYLLFQNHFQDHQNPPDKNQNVVSFLLSNVVMQWKNHSFPSQCCKKLIKKIVEIVPTSQSGIWRQFLLHFKRGSSIYLKEIKEWLWTKEKAQYALSLLRQLGPLPRSLIENAEQLKFSVD